MNSRVLCSCLCLLLIVSGFVGGSVAHAETRQMPWESKPAPRLIEDRFRVEVGMWSANINTEIRSDATAQQPGTRLNGERDIGLADKQQLPDFELTLFPARHHLLRLNGLTTRRTGNAVLRQTVQYDGKTYNAGEVVNSTLNLRVIGLTYGYRFIATPRYELTATASVQVASMEANAFVPRLAQREPDIVNTPLAQVGAEARWEVFRHWALLGRYQWLQVSVNDGADHGSYIDWRAGLQWQASPHLGVALFYRHYGISVESTRGSHPGLVDLSYRGPVLGLRASF